MFLPFFALDGRLRSAYFLLLFIAVAASLVEADVVVVPIAGVERYSLDKRTIARPMVAVQARSASASDTGMLSASWTAHIREGASSPGPDEYHDASLFATYRRGRGQMLGVFRGASDEPVVGGVRTFQAGVAFAYDAWSGARSRLSLGGGVAGGGLGVELPDGTDVLVAPFPVVRWTWASESVSAGVDFVTSPSVNVSVRHGRSRMEGTAGFSGLRDARDLDFDVSAGMRLFDSTDRWGDVAGVYAGFRNTSWHFRRGNGAEYDANCYAPYMRVDLALVQLSAGYGFGGRERFDGKERRMGNGVFGGVSLALPLGG